MTDHPSTPHPPAHSVPREVRDHFGISEGVVLNSHEVTTWRVVRGGRPFVLKSPAAAANPDWEYQVRAADALRELGWPTPALAQEPFHRPEGAWLLFDHLPGSHISPEDSHAEAARGRLLAQFRTSALEAGIVEQRAGFAAPQDVVGDPGLDRLLAVHESAHPAESRMLREFRDTAAAWFADLGVDTDPCPGPGPHPDSAPRSVIHGDFTGWNLLFLDGRLSGVLDFEASHYSFQVADFALSWRGYHDDVIRGYDQERPLSELEWELVLPTYWAWLFIGMKDHLAAHYEQPPQTRAPLDLTWQTAHFAKRSDLVLGRINPRKLPIRPPAAPPPPPPLPPPPGSARPGTRPAAR